MEETLTLARARLAAMGTDDCREGMQRYFKEAIRAYGVSAPQVRALAKEIYPLVKPWPPAQRNRLCTELLKSGMSEEGALAIYLYRRFARGCHECEFLLFERWIDRYVDNWAWCDGIACWLVAASLANDPALVAEIPEWTASKNRWKRRAAAVALVPSGRRAEHTSVILDIAERLGDDGDDMVRKGLGWMLKDTYPKAPRAVLDFVTGREPALPRLVVRVAAGKMTAAHRARAMARR